MNCEEILSVPLDCEFILRKQKSLRRSLISKNNFIEKRIAILGGSTTNDFKNILELFLLNSGIKPIFYESEYNKYYEDSVFGNEELDEFKPEIIFIYTSFVNLINRPDIKDNSEIIDEKISNEYERYLQIWESLSSRYNAIIIQNNMEYDYVNSLGNFDTISIFGMRHYIDSLNELFAKYAREHKNFYIHDIHMLSVKIGIDKWYNRFQYYAYKFAINYDVIPLVAHNASNLIKAILGKTKKCLVLDLDNTLWGGIIGDDGVVNLKLGNETPEGEAYTEFQKYVLSLKQRGIILAVCSKNEEEVAKIGFSHPDSILKLDDFISFKANWKPKNLNIEEIAKEINIGLDSLVFIDDNPVERQLVRDTLPDVAVPEVDSQDVFSYIKAIEDNGFFEIVAISNDDLQRNQAYLENKKRQDLQRNMKSYDEFLKSLNMQAEIGYFKEVYYDRIAQLTNKSNQFNLTTKRYTLADIKKMAEDDRYITIYGRLKDNFGDNGLVSVVIGEIKDNNLHIILWLMSCRVLKRGMEEAMLDELVKQSRIRNIDNIYGYYYKTSKNKMVKELYKDFGFKKLKEVNEDSVWILNYLKDYKFRNKYIGVNDE